jgi:hypothetical protein
MPGEAIETIVGKTALEWRFREAWNTDPDGSLTPAHLTDLHTEGFERLAADHLLANQRLERDASQRRLDLRHVV